MKTTKKITANKMELVKTRIVALNTKEQEKIAGGQGPMAPALQILQPPKPASYGCTL